MDFNGNKHIPLVCDLQKRFIKILNFDKDHKVNIQFISLIKPSSHSFSNALGA